MLKKKNKLASFSGVQLPVVVERDEDGMYVVECTVLNGCYSQGQTIDEALQNIREAISLALEDGMGQEVLHAPQTSEFSLHLVTV